MNPEEEWAWEEKLDHLSYRLEELVLDVFISVLEKLKNRNEFLSQPAATPVEDDMPF
jgi:hypothetical protein